MAERFINIRFPFNDDPKGKFLEMNKGSDESIKSDLIHLLLTNKGERLYLPEFGANLKQYIFEPNDSATHNKIREEINVAISKFIPNLQVDEISIEKPEDTDHTAIIRIDYTVTEGAFSRQDFVVIQI